jgi:hypothetical protein
MKRTFTRTTTTAAVLAAAVYATGGAACGSTPCDKLQDDCNASTCPADMQSDCFRIVDAKDQDQCQTIVDLGTYTTVCDQLGPTGTGGGSGPGPGSGGGGPGAGGSTSSGPSCSGVAVDCTSDPLACCMGLSCTENVCCVPFSKSGCTQSSDCCALDPPLVCNNGTCEM